MNSFSLRPSVSKTKTLILSGSFVGSKKISGFSIAMTLFESNVLLGILVLQPMNKIKFALIIKNL